MELNRSTSERVAGRCMMPGRGWKAPVELYGSFRGSLTGQRFGRAIGASESGAEQLAACGHHPKKSGGSLRWITWEVSQPRSCGVGIRKGRGASVCGQTRGRARVGCTVWLSGFNVDCIVDLGMTTSRQQSCRDRNRPHRSELQAGRLAEPGVEGNGRVVWLDPWKSNGLSIRANTRSSRTWCRTLER